MLNSRGVSEPLEQLYKEYKLLVTRLYPLVASQGKSVMLLRDQNLLTEFHGRYTFYVKEGYLKLRKGAREIRMYSNGDFIPSVEKWSPQYAIGSDFKSDLIQFNTSDFLDLCKKNNDAWDIWQEMCEVENRLNLCLCGDFAPEVFDFEMVVKSFSQGDIIISGEDESAVVYEMISGKADVFVENVFVGTVTHGELFGELAFLTDNVTNIHVVAKKNCFVRILEPNIFHHLVETNQQFAAMLIKNMARKVNSLNEYIVKQK